jgi:hypothetical protein
MDLGLQELASTCFPDEMMSAMQRKFDATAGAKSTQFQICSSNLALMAQHQCSSKEKVRVKISCMNRRKITIEEEELEIGSFQMILRCSHDIPMSSIKKIFSRKFLPSNSNLLLNLFTSDMILLRDTDTIRDLLMLGRGFDGHTQVRIMADVQLDEDSLPIDDDMPVLEAQNYVPETSPTCSNEVEEEPEKEELPVEEEKVEVPSKRKPSLPDEKPTKAKRPRSSQEQVPSTSIFAASPNNIMPPFPSLDPNIFAMQIFQQMLANSAQASTMPPIFPFYQQPTFTAAQMQKFLLDAQSNAFLARMMGKLAAAHKPNATVTPIRREATNTAIKEKAKVSTQNYKDEPSPPADKVPQIFACSKV